MVRWNDHRISSFTQQKDIDLATNSCDASQISESTKEGTQVTIEITLSTLKNDFNAEILREN